jgi:hypothetical protein
MSEPTPGQSGPLPKLDPVAQAKAFLKSRKAVLEEARTALRLGNIEEAENLKSQVFDITGNKEIDDLLTGGTAPDEKTAEELGDLLSDLTFLDDALQNDISKKKLDLSKGEASTEEVIIPKVEVPAPRPETVDVEETIHVMADPALEENLEADNGVPPIKSTKGREVSVEDTRSSIIEAIESMEGRRTDNEERGQMYERLFPETLMESSFLRQEERIELGKLKSELEILLRQEKVDQIMEESETAKSSAAKVGSYLNVFKKLEETRDKEKRKKRKDAIIARLKELETVVNSRESAARSERQEKENSLKEDKAKNPFKYYLLERMHPLLFQIMFSIYKKDFSAENLDKVNERMGESGEELKFFTIGNVSDFQVANTAMGSSNGFTLRITNTKAVRTKSGEVDRESPKARYDLYGPDGIKRTEDIGYQDGVELLKKEAGIYQKEQYDRFIGKKSQ